MPLTLTQQLTALYDAAFDRPPDDAGLAHHTNLILSGQMDLYSIADAFAASEEFTLTTGAGGTPAVIVQRLYHNSLDRGGSLDESAGWLDLILSGKADMGDTLVGFALSAEYATLVGWNHDTA